MGYEPLWAIGSGRVPTSQEIMQMHAHVRECLVVHLGPHGKNVRILYGSSVNLTDSPRYPGSRRIGGRGETEDRELLGDPREHPFDFNASLGRSLAEERPKMRTGIVSDPAGGWKPSGPRGLIQSPCVPSGVSPRRGAASAT